MEDSTNSTPGSFTDQLWSVLAARRNTSLRRLLAPGPDEESLQRICEAAGHAPDHAKQRSWRLIMIPAHKRSELGMAFVDALEQREPGLDEPARKAAYDKAFHAPCLLVAILRDDPVLSDVPQAERLISLGCAIQNMLTAAEALGIASGLASGASLASPGMGRLLGLQSSEQAVCFIGFGSAERLKAPRPWPHPAQYLTIL
ncbi:nitroreductase family protein [Massilia brevitalea]|uniref:nitroreductase family protein n=1 Tax=Massilia brevitalea TaxID=442526 RepID=UPI002739BED0|nr:nitroreductase family protein [Massilia brevitalea]